ncbi:MAG: radical SAM protein [Humidesulfovibrio sp.]|nr:radical SAM protein [Humidesulfovibrio sp.]
MEQGALHYVFGPVLSGRLGRSLGLDLLGERICSMNCVYCESGQLEHLTLDRASYVSTQVLLAELRAWEADRARRGDPLPDVVTLGGRGEPTLNSDMPEIIRGARTILPGVPVAVLTNASLMTDPAVRAELAQADMVLPNMDSLVPEEFARVNRGHPSLDPTSVAEGILAFRRASRAKIFLEVLLVAGVNDSTRNLELLANYCARLRPDRVDVVTLSRPGAEIWARPVDKDVLALWRARLGPLAASTSGAGPEAGADNPAGLAGRGEKRQEQSGGMTRDEVRASILASLSRRPQTAAQLASALFASADDVELALSELLTQGLAEKVRQDGGQTDGQAVRAGTDGAVFYQARG